MNLIPDALCPQSLNRHFCTSKAVFKQSVCLTKASHPTHSTGVVKTHQRPETNNRSPDVSQEATIDDDWNIGGDKSLSVTRFAVRNKNPPETHMWLQGRLTKKQVASRPWKLARIMVKSVKELSAQSREQMDGRKNSEVFTSFWTLILMRKS